MLKPGMILSDRYEILDIVGAGGMSIVYKAKCHRLNRNVAIKVLKPEFSTDRSFVTKFRVEAQASAGLTHPNIVNVFDVCEDEGIHFIVMELIEGITLKEYIKENGRLGMDRVLDFSIQIASGLEAAHESHVIHRDIKPQNVIVSRSGNLKVTDFGIAKAASSNTLTHAAEGSVHYISPEQARGGYSDERSDIYSLGIVMYEMVTGRVPYEGDNNVSVALMHIQNEMIRPREYYPDIYSSFEKIILKATQKKPERRYLTAAALIADLKRVQNNPNIDIVVAASPLADGPTQQWTTEDIRAIRDGNAQKPQDNSQLNVFPTNPPLQNEMGELEPTGVSTIQVSNPNVDRYKEEGSSWDDYFDDEDDEEEVPRKGVKRVNDDDDDDDDDYDIDPKLRKAVAIAGIATAVIIAIILMVIFGKVMGWFDGGNGKEEDKTTADTEITTEAGIPMIDVVGISEDAAKTELSKAGFTNVTVEPVINADVQAGYVFEQSVKKDEIIAAGDAIVIKVSSGPEEKDIPNVVGQPDAQATILLEEAGFKVSHAFEFHETVEKDMVISQSPVEGSKAPSGSVVTIVVSNGKEIKQTAVPNLLNLTEAQAIAQLTDAKLVAGPATKESHETIPAGYVISQSIASGTSVNEGETVTFVISEGPVPKTTTYTANVTGSITCNDPLLEGITVTVQVKYNDNVISEQQTAITNGATTSVNGSLPGLESQNGTADIVVIDAEGNNVTASFTKGAISITYETVTE